MSRIVDLRAHEVSEACHATEELFKPIGTATWLNQRPKTVGHYKKPLKVVWSSL
jgi:hypothetical protein